MSLKRIYIAGTCDTKGDELAYVKQLVGTNAMPAVLVDVSTGEPKTTPADVSAAEVAACHPLGEAAVFTDDRGRSVSAMAQAFERFLVARDDVAGVIGLGGSSGTVLITQGMRALPIGLPKLMVSTVASGNVASYVGPSDICMMYSVTDVAGLNRDLANNSGQRCARHRWYGECLNRSERRQAGARPDHVRRDDSLRYADRRSPQAHL